MVRLCKTAEHHSDGIGEPFDLTIYDGSRDSPPAMKRIHRAPLSLCVPALRIDAIADIQTNDGTR